MIPLGSVALTCAVQLIDGKFLLGSRKKGTKPDPSEYAVYMAHAPFDYGADNYHAAETRLSALSSLISSLNRLPASMRDKVQQWRSEMEKAKTAADVAVDTTT